MGYYAPAIKDGIHCPNCGHEKNGHREIKNVRYRFTTNKCDGISEIVYKPWFSKFKRIKEKPCSCQFTQKEIQLNLTEIDDVYSILDLPDVP